MYERSTDHGTSQKAKEVYPQEKLQVLKEWELCGNGVEIAKEYEIHPHTPCIGGGRPWSREGRPCSVGSEPK